MARKHELVIAFNIYK